MPSPALLWALSVFIVCGIVIVLLDIVVEMRRWTDIRTIIASNGVEMFG